MTTDINDPIKVAVIFESQNIRPVWFVWRGNKIIIKKIISRWEQRKGLHKTVYYSITDGYSLFAIGMESGSFLWFLRAVSDYE